MSYQYENLSPEVFQKLCQALLIQSYPNLQCLPIGQPDGGRDAVSRLERATGASTANFIVFQVKFNRKGPAESNPHKWLVDEIKGELPKITKLIPKGAKQYILITNIPGTAHLDTGAIDNLTKFFRNSPFLPAAFGGMTLTDVSIVHGE